MSGETAAAEGLRRRVLELERQLDEARQTVRTLQSGEIDSLVTGGASSPVLLRATQDSLRANEQLLRAVFDGAMEAILIADDQGVYVDVNPAACALFGLRREELIGRAVADFTDGVDAKAAWDRFLAEGSMQGQVRLRAASRSRDVEFRATAHIVSGRHLSVLRDVTERREAEAALTETELRLQTVISHAPIILFAVDNEGIYTVHEGKGVESVGLRPGQIVGQSVFARQAETPGANASVRRALAGEEVFGPFDVGGRSFDCTVVPVRGADGVITGITGVAVDVTANRKVEAALRASEARFRGMIENATEGILLIGPQGIVTYASPSTQRILGYAPDAIVGTAVTDWIHADDRTRIEREMGALVHDPALARVLEFRVRHADGSARWVEAMGSNMLDDPAVASLVSNFRDITERKATEIALRESQGLLEEAQRVAHLGSWTSASAPERKISWSAECARIFGRAPEDPPTAVEFLQMVHPEDRARVVAASNAADGICETEHRVVLPGGEVRWVQARAVIEGRLLWDDAKATAVRDTEGREYRVVGVVQDITERKQAEAALLASELRYRRIVENTSEGVWSYDADGNTTFMNRRMAEMLRSSVAEALGKPIFTFMDATWREEGQRRAERRAEGLAERGEFRLQRSDGEALWVSIHADPLHDAEGRYEGTIALVSDITESRREAEARNRLAAIVESSDDAIISRDVGGTITSWNRGAERLYYWTSGEVLGQPASLMLPPDRLAEDRAIVERILRGEIVVNYETRRGRKDGSSVEVALNVSSIRDGKGVIVGCSEIARDLTEQRKALTALRRTEDQLRQAQKMEAIGVLAGGIAHDFNNLLSVILSYSSLVIDELRSPDPIREDLEQIEKAAQRATELTRQLLAFGRQQVLQPAVIDLNHVLHGVNKILSRAVGEDIQVTILPGANLARVHADPGQVEQVILNLVVNARDAMPTGGKLTIETSNALLDASYAAEHPGVVAGAYALLAITDTGMGMDRTTRDRIFEPFFTTKAKGKGTGLGLSTVYGIVQQSGGHIWVYSEPGYGTTFKVYLPATDRTVDEASASVPASPTLHGSETILLVEDDDQVRASSRAILRKFGYNVLEAQNAGEAFLICEQFTAKIHLLLTDVVMPRMSGRQLADRLAPMRAGMRVLFVSGYTEDSIVHHGILDAGIMFLQKPITPEALLRKVRQVLDSKL